MAAIDCSVGQRLRGVGQDRFKRLPVNGTAGPEVRGLSDALVRLSLGYLHSDHQNFGPGACPDLFGRCLGLQRGQDPVIDVGGDAGGVLTPRLDVEQDSRCQLREVQPDELLARGVIRSEGRGHGLRVSRLIRKHVRILARRTDG